MIASQCEKIVADFASAAQLRTPIAGAYILTTKGGPNAVLKIIIPPVQSRPAYILTVARSVETSVIDHEVNILHRLKTVLPESLQSTIPAVVARGEWSGHPAFATLWYEASPERSVGSRLNKGRRSQWILDWLTELGRCTLGHDLSAAKLEKDYAPTIARLQEDKAIAKETKARVQQSYDVVVRAADQLPSVCCHGDVWSGNILWTGGENNAVVIDWGAARWPGLPCVDLCRYLLSHRRFESSIESAIKDYCQALDLDPAMVCPLYDLYNVFVKAESDLACAYQPHANFDPFACGGGAETQRRYALLKSAIGV